MAESPATARRLGIDLLQVDYGGEGRPHDLLKSTRLCRRLENTAGDENVFISAVAINALNDIGILDNSDSTRRNRESLVRNAIEAAHQLGAQSLLIPAFRRSAIKNMGDVNTTGQFLREVASWAEDASLYICHENTLHPCSLKILLEIVANDSVNILFDTGNLEQERVNWREYINQAGSRVYQDIHIKDFRSHPAGAVPLGEGYAPLTLMIQTLITRKRLRALFIETDHRESTLREINEDARFAQRLLVKYFNSQETQ